MRIIEIVEWAERLIAGGKTEKQAFAHIERELGKLDREKAKEPGKCYGVCESCEQKTVLVEENQLCGPCCFGEAATANGNW